MTTGLASGLESSESAATGVTPTSSEVAALQATPVAQRDAAIRRLLSAELGIDATAVELQVPADLVTRIAVIAGLPAVVPDLPREPHATYQPSQDAQQILDSIGWRIEEKVHDHPRCSARDAALCDSVILEDITLEEAGRRVPFTREAMRLTLQKHTGLSTRDLREHREALREARRVAVGRSVVQRLASEDPGMVVGDLASASSLSVEEVESILGVEESLRRRRANTWTTGIEEDSILAEMRRVGEMAGGSPLGAQFYDQHRSAGMPGSIRITQRFGVWSTACNAAGIPSNRPVRNDYQRQWTEDELVEWVRKYIGDAGAGATYRGFAEWLSGRAGEGAPSAQTVRNRLGTWSEILRLATSDVTVVEGRSVSGQVAVERIFEATSLLGMPDTRWDAVETDSELLTSIRLEQAHLRRYLLGDAELAQCSLCGRRLPSRVLVAAHLVPRRFLTDSERREFASAATLLCVLGCDALFEWGYLVVDPQGVIRAGRTAESAELARHAEQLVGRICLAHNAATSRRFAEHSALHCQAGEDSIPG